MNEFIVQMKREWLEHFGAFFWPPVALLVLAVILMISSQTIAWEISADSFDEQLELHERMAEEHPDGAPDGLALITSMLLDAAGSTDTELAQKLKLVLTAVAQPFYIQFVIVAFFVLIYSVHSERQDRSVLFWKSMPVSDVTTILSKYVVVAWVAPLFTIAALCLTQLLMVTQLSLNVEDGMGSRVWGQAALLTRWSEVIFGYLIYGLWAAPAFAFWLLISSWVKGAPILWALGIPFAVYVLEYALRRDNAVMDALGSHIAFAPLPGFRDQVTGEQSGPWLAEQVGILFSLDLWGGVVVGAAMLAGAIYCRRRFNEV